MYQILIQIENKCASVNCKQISSRKTSHTHIKFRPNKMIGGLRKCCSIVCKDLLKDVRYSLLSCAKPSYFMIIFQIAIQGKNKYKIKVSKCLSTLQNVPFELLDMIYLALQSVERIWQRIFGKTCIIPYSIFC